MSGSERFTTIATIPTTTGTTEHALLQAGSTTAHQIDAVHRIVLNADIVMLKFCPSFSL